MRDMTDSVFFADTYALIELAGGNVNYQPYLNQLIVTSKFNLIELYYYFLRTYGKETADRFLKLYSKIIIPITFSSMRSGMEFKLRHKDEKISYVDAIGYALAFESGIEFLTGDQKFRSKSNVRFVK